MSLLYFRHQILQDYGIPSLLSVVSVTYDDSGKLKNISKEIKLLTVKARFLKADVEILGIKVIRYKRWKTEIGGIFPYGKKFVIELITDF